jgi:Arc/MetJ-type ribon-helix-helix transcriptional regulator
VEFLLISFKKLLMFEDKKIAKTRRIPKLYFKIMQNIIERGEAKSFSQIVRNAVKLLIERDAKILALYNRRVLGNKRKFQTTIESFLSEKTLKDAEVNEGG